LKSPLLPRTFDRPKLTSGSRGAIRRACSNKRSAQSTSRASTTTECARLLSTITLLGSRAYALVAADQRLAAAVGAAHRHSAANRRAPHSTWQRPPHGPDSFVVACSSSRSRSRAGGPVRAPHAIRLEVTDAALVRPGTVCIASYTARPPQGPRIDPTGEAGIIGVTSDISGAEKAGRDDYRSMPVDTRADTETVRARFDSCPARRRIIHAVLNFAGWHLEVSVSSTGRLTR